MVNFRIDDALLFVLELTVLFVSGETETLTLCERSEQVDKILICPKDEIISLKTITYGGSRCHDTSNSNGCLSYINTYFSNHCTRKNNCTLSNEILSSIDRTCMVPPRRLEVHFKCEWFFGTSYYILHTCTNSVAAIGCPIFRYIYIESVKDESGCTSNGTSFVKTHLITSCDKIRKCSIRPSTNVFHDRFVSVSYVCKDLDHELDITTVPAVNATAENDILPVFSFDNDHRIEINHHSLNRTLYLCSLGWDNFDAGVLCKSFNRNWIGKAIVVNNIQNLKIASYSQQCGGLETSLFECNNTKDEQGCNIEKVAGAICCEDTDKPGECVMNPSSNKVSSESSNIAGIHVTIVSVLFVTTVAALVIIFIVCYRKKRAENFKPCQTEENTTGRTDSSNYNVINYSEMSDISIIKMNENRNEIHTTQHHLQNIKTSIKQNQNICTKKESLSTNQNSLEHIYESDSTLNNQCELLTKQRDLDKHTYESTELVQPPDIKTSMEQHQIICHKYESLSTNRNSDKHIYESDSIHINQYESLSKPPESEKHTYESTELTQPHDIAQDQHICIKYESLSTNRNSDKHIYESTHTNQYESLKKQQESDKHTYESTEHAKPNDILKISTDQEDNFCNKYESLSTNRNSVEHTYESTEQTVPVSQYQSLNNPQESDKHVYASTESQH